ncbi:MAG TPA: ABC transporter permease [Ornithinibacter sp.]|nr:ABC transporter permease [Ornithinibacter sp.]HQA14014.1 ABC transporter permease [Ornithinibacter sp.]HQD68162.1 ABC transporter permease [Ornithinibacter sp.]
MSTTTQTPAPAPSAPVAAAPRKIDWGVVLVEGRALIGLIVIIAVFTALSPNFLKFDNLLLMTRHVAMNALLALGMLLVILRGGIDLSVGSIVGLSGVMAGYLLKGAHIPFTDVTAFPPVWVIVIISLLVGALVGWVNGILVTRFNVAPFIATLGMLYVARGIALLMTDGVPITDELRGNDKIGNTGFITVLASAPLGVPMPVWVMVVFAIAASVLLTRTPFGRWLYAMGGNLRAANLSGVPTKKVETWIYVLSGLCAAVVGILLTADLPAATPRAGESYELNAIAAVVIGGAALSGGRGTVRGTMIGAFLVGFLVDGLVLVGVSVFWQQIIKGAVIVLAVALDQMQQSLQARSATRRAAQASLSARAKTAPAK